MELGSLSAHSGNWLPRALLTQRRIRNNRIADTHNVHCWCSINRIKIGESLADKAGVNELQNSNLPTDKDAGFVKWFSPLQNLHTARSIAPSCTGTAPVSESNHSQPSPTAELHFKPVQFQRPRVNLKSVKWGFVGHSALDQVLRGQLSSRTTSGFHSYSCWQPQQKHWWICRHKASFNCPSWGTLEMRWQSKGSHCCSPLFDLCCDGNHHHLCSF